MGGGLASASASFSGCNARQTGHSRNVMKLFLTLTVTALSMAAFATSTLAGDGCGGKEGKDKKETSEESTTS